MKSSMGGYNSYITTGTIGYDRNTKIDSIEEKINNVEKKIDSVEDQLIKIVSHIETIMIVLKARLPTDDNLEM